MTHRLRTTGLSHLSALFLFLSWQHTGVVEQSRATAVTVRAMAHGRLSDTLGILLPHHQTKSVVMIAFVVKKIAVIKSPLDLRRGEQFSHTHTWVIVWGPVGT